MKIGRKLILAVGLGLSLMQLPLQAQGTNNAAASFKDDREKASYGVGMYFGNMIKRGNLDVDAETVFEAMKDVLAGKETKLTQMDGQKAIQEYQQAMRLKQAAKNKEEGEKFLAQNKTKPGVKTLEVELSETNKVEMQYKVVTDGTGPVPKTSDMVSVNYKGTLIDGKEFDSSAKHGQPFKFMVGRGVIRGWSAAVEHMKVGSKWELYIPSALAYGDMGSQGIEPGSTLIFEVELLSIDAPPAAPAAPQPLTSDIIKVPSAEELKKGAKIEVIKPEDAARMAAEAATNNANKK
jgi:FKBP-type peptidyl-prolyl cis-trans isomerase